MKKKFTNIADSSFTDWVKSPEYNKWCEDHEAERSKVVFKRDCLNHIAKNFRKDMENLARSGAKVEGLKTINRCKNGLGQIAIIRLSKRYRQTIFQGKVPSDSAEVDISRAVGKLRTNLYAALYHSILFDDPAVRHQYCPDGPESWCPYKRGVKDWDSTKSHHISPLLLPLVLEVFRKRTTDQYLRRVICGYNQNLRLSP